MVQSRKDTNFIHIYSYIQDTINNTETERRLFFFPFFPYFFSTLEVMFRSYFCYNIFCYSSP